MKNYLIEFMMNGRNAGQNALINEWMKNDLIEYMNEKERMTIWQNEWMNGWIWWMKELKTKWMKCMTECINEWKTI